LKNTGRIIVLLFVLLLASAAQAADITISAGSNVISPGESTELVIKVQSGSVEINQTVVPRVDGLNISYGGSGSSYQYINGKSSSTTTITFHVYGVKEGSYTIPSFTVTAGGEKLYTQPVSITVKKGAQGSGGDSSINVFCDVELSSDSCYSGQTVMLRYFIYHPAGADLRVNRVLKQPLSDGFIVKEINETIASTDSVKKGLNLVKEHVVTYCLIPELTGSRETGGGSMLVTAEQERGFFSRPVQGELLFPEKKLMVIPLPAKGKPSGFSGDVGEFKLEAAVKSGKYMVNQEIQIPVTVTGRGNFFLMSKPAFENADGIRVLVEESNPELVLDGNEVTGTKKFLVTIIPQAEGSFKPGVLTLKYFNPVTHAYVSASSEALSLEVSGIAVPAAEKNNKHDDPGTGLPVFAYIGAGALIAAALFGLAYIIIRERRKYAGLRSGENKKNETVKEIKADPVKLLRDELEDAHGSGESDKLVKLCYRGLDMLNETSAGKNSPELAAVKAKLDAARYANASLSAGELEEVYGVVDGLMKNIK